MSLAKNDEQASSATAPTTNAYLATDKGRVELEGELAVVPVSWGVSERLLSSWRGAISPSLQSRRAQGASQETGALGPQPFGKSRLSTACRQVPTAYVMTAADAQCLAHAKGSSPSTGSDVFFSKQGAIQYILIYRTMWSNELAGWLKRNSFMARPTAAMAAAT